MRVIKKGVANLAANRNFDAILEPNSGDLELWLAISEMLLTASKTLPKFYKLPSKSTGFPLKKDAINEAQAQRFELNRNNLKQILIDLTEAQDSPNIVNLLNQIRHLPNDIQSSIENPVLKAVTELLPIAASYLKLVFTEKNVIDFTELSIASLEALGSENAPTEFALALDYKIEHILLDEFQDTSSPQIRLIELLTAGWDASQNKTLFLVGDPMQSIYRFRDANVSLFLQVIQRGIGQLKPDFKQLKVNFRSNQKIIEWVNDQFYELMPKKADLAFSAVSYSSSTAFHATSETSQVTTMLTVDAENYQLEAKAIVQLVEQHLKENQSRILAEIKDDSKDSSEPKTLAILARKKNHLVEIIEQLNEKSILFQALDLEGLANKMIVSDITSLALALTDTNDQLSWVAVMRSPWYGLRINDIKQIVSLVTRIGCDFPFAINLLISKNHSNESDELINADSLARIAVIQPILCHALAHKGRKPFTKWLSGCFDSVGGRLQIDTAAEHKDLETCIETIAQFEKGGEIIDRAGLQQSIERLYAAPNPLANNQVQLMTIHKSKGLEFDTVILPRTDSWRSRPDIPLLRWTEVIDNQGAGHNILAISKETGKENDSIYEYIGYLEKQKEKYEAQRLLYVATTRAKSKLYLFGGISLDQKKTNDIDIVYKKPSGNSFLSMLWHGVGDNFELISNPAEPVKNELLAAPQKLTESQLSLLSNQINLDTKTKQLEYIFPSRKSKRVFLSKIDAVPKMFRSSDREVVRSSTVGIVKNIAGQSSRIVKRVKTEKLVSIGDKATIIGKVVHRQLEWLANQNLFEPSAAANSEFSLPSHWRDITRSQLIEMGFSGSQEETTQALDIVTKAIKNTLSDKIGRFILATHSEAKSEFELKIITPQGEYQTRIIDRTFVFEGQRWIIDYKTSQPSSGVTLNDFLLDEKTKYQEQLQGYISLFRKLENKPVVAGLYFPRIQHFERY